MSVKQLVHTSTPQGLVVNQDKLRSQLAILGRLNWSNKGIPQAHVLNNLIIFLIWIGGQTYWVTDAAGLHHSTMATNRGLLVLDLNYIIED